VKSFLKISIFAGASLLSAISSVGQRGTTPAGAAANTAAKPAIGRDTSPLNPENSLEIIKPPTPAEEKAYKAFTKFQKMPDNELAAKAQAGEDFVKKFPSTSYTPFVYAFLTVAYIQGNMMDKAQSSADKDLQLNPQDFRTMAVMSQALARLTRDGMPETQAQLGKSESYGKSAMTGVAALAKPEGMTDERFASVKNQTLNMAHSGVGLVLLHRNDFAGAISELEQAVAIGPNDDPTNYYLLGVAYQNSGHPDKAVPYLEKCAAVTGNLQQACTANLEQSKKDSAQQGPSK
jgi:tetratricopeptide (TPR) repeat protein